MKKPTKQKHTRTKKEDFAIEVVETKDFAGRIVLDGEGRKTLKIASPTWYKHQLQKFRENEMVTMYISTRKPKRTQQQNRYLWGVYLPMVAKETGEPDLDRLYKLFIGKFSTKEIVTVLGQQVRMTKGSSEMSKYEFSEFIERIEAETGIMAPPTENYYL